MQGIKTRHDFIFPDFYINLLFNALFFFLMDGLEGLIWLLSVAGITLSIIMIVKTFIMFKDISRIRQLMEKKDEDQDSKNEQTTPETKE